MLRQVLLISGVLLCLALLSCGENSSSGNMSSNSIVTDNLVNSGISQNNASLESQLLDRLSLLLTAQAISEGGLRTSAAVPAGDSGKVTTLALDSGTNELSWLYVNTGDYDFSGDVGVPDITPIAQNYLAITTDGQGNDDIERWIDGDGDGEVGVSDISPIAQNYLNNVSGYKVYRSDSFSDVPATDDAPNGAGAIEIGDLTMGDGVTNTEGLTEFTYQLSGDFSDLYVWVRPYVGSALGAPSNVLMPPQVERYDIAKIPFSYNVYVDLTKVNDNPAVCYYDSTETSEGLYYKRANNAEGTDWPTDAVLVDSGGRGDCEFVILNDGRPGIFYSKLDPDSLWGRARLAFVIAVDVNGNDWATPTFADMATYNPTAISGVLVDGLFPAASYHADMEDNSDYEVLRYVSASNDVGGSFSLPQTLDNGNGYEGIITTMRVVNGNPAILYYCDTFSAQELRYIRATDEAGTSWGTPVLLDDLGFFNMPEFEPLNMEVINGYPTVFYADGAGEVHLYKANDVSGDNWPTPVNTYETGFITMWMPILEERATSDLTETGNWYAGFRGYNFSDADRFWYYAFSAANLVLSNAQGSYEPGEQMRAILAAVGFMAVLQGDQNVLEMTLMYAAEDNQSEFIDIFMSKLACAFLL